MNERHDNNKGGVIVPKAMCFIFLFLLVHIMYKDYRRTQEYELTMEMLSQKLEQFEEDVERMCGLIDKLDDSCQKNETIVK